MSHRPDVDRLFREVDVLILGTYCVPPTGGRMEDARWSISFPPEGD